MRSPIWKRLSALILSAALVLSLAACGSNNGGTNSDNTTGNTDPAPSSDQAEQPTDGGDAAVDDAVSKLAGAYMVDITPLGMPITFYLVISEDGTFQLTNEVTDGAVSGSDKGNGRVGFSDGVYMLLYSDSTAEASKTATFELDGTSLVFTTALPYGSSNISPNTDGAEPIYATAKSMAYSQYLGDYAGSFEKSVEAMGSSITYDFCLTLGYGAEYSFESSFVVMGAPQTFVQAGTFAVDSGKLTLTSAEGAVAEGTISDAGEIAISLPLSAMAKEGDAITMQPATTADYAGTYSGVKNMEMGPMVMAVNVTLKLDMLGGYTYSAAMEGEEPYTETGVYAPNEDGTLTFTAEGGEPQTGTLSSSDSLTANFRINAAVPNATEVTFFSSRVQGTFEADDMDGTGTHGVLTLNPDGTYHFAVTKDGAAVSEEKGTFSTGAGMAGSAVSLLSETGSVSSGSVFDGGINLNYTTSSGSALGYQLLPKAAEGEGGMPAGMGK